MFLNITPSVTNWSQDHKEFSLVLDENPLAEFVELPPDILQPKDESTDMSSSEPLKQTSSLWYSNILCGVLRGCLEMVSFLTLCLSEAMLAI